MNSDLVAIRGNTFPVKDQLKALGGRWNAGEKCWMVPADRAEDAQRIVDSAPAPERMEGGRAVQTKRCWECGRTVTRAECQRNGGDWSESVAGAGGCYCGC